MVSRKRNKGKERKAKQVEKKAETKARMVWEEWVHSDCDHELGAIIPDNEDHPVSSFMDDFFINWLDKDIVCKYLDYYQDIGAMQILIDTYDKHMKVWRNESYRKIVINILINL